MTAPEFLTTRNATLPDMVDIPSRHLWLST
jgi:hypothetical protein